MKINTTTRRLGAVVSGTILLLGAGIGTASAASPHGQTLTQTDNAHGYFYEPNATNPCTGDSFNGGQGALFNGNAVQHVTYFTNSDEAWFTFTETGSVTATDDGTGVSYSGNATAWGNGNFNERNMNETFTLTIHLAGNDGSSITAHEVTTLVYNGNGNITATFDDMSLSCG